MVARVNVTKGREGPISIPNNRIASLPRVGYMRSYCHPYAIARQFAGAKYFHCSHILYNKIICNII